MRRIRVSSVGGLAACSQLGSTSSGQSHPIRKKRKNILEDKGPVQPLRTGLPRRLSPPTRLPHDPPRPDHPTTGTSISASIFASMIAIVNSERLKEVKGPIKPCFVQEYRGHKRHYREYKCRVWSRSRVHGRRGRGRGYGAREYSYEALLDMFLQLPQGHGAPFLSIRICQV